MEKDKCCICEKIIDKDKEQWYWGDEPAHKECVIKDADVICSKKCGWLSISDDLGTECGDCYGVMEKITEKDKEKIRKNNGN